VALLWKQGAFRGLGNYELLPEKGDTPSLRVGFGLQGIGTGNPGYFATSEKTWTDQWGTWTGYVGLGYRSNEDHAHGLGGLKLSLPGPWTFGAQLDGHNAHLFTSHSLNQQWSVGLYWVELKSLGVMVSFAR
jgi:hypothetical protein